MSDHLKYMQRAFELAQQAKTNDEVPVGAVVVLNDEIIGEGANQPISANDPTAHAEIIALRNAGNHVGNYRLPEATVYVTLEPCAMCAGAMVHARICKLIYAADDPKTGACGSVFDLLQMDELNHKVEIEKGLLEEECRSLLQNFFKSKRNSKSK